MYMDIEDFMFVLDEEYSEYSDEFNEIEEEYNKKYFKEYEDYKKEEKVILEKKKELEKEFKEPFRKMLEYKDRIEQLNHDIYEYGDVEHPLKERLDEINEKIKQKYSIEILVFTQEDIDLYRSVIILGNNYYGNSNKKQIQFLDEHKSSIESIKEQISDKGYSIIFSTSFILDNDSVRFNTLNSLSKEFRKIYKSYYPVSVKLKECYEELKQLNENVSEIYKELFPARLRFNEIQEELSALQRAKRPTITSKNSYKRSQYDIYMDEISFDKILKDCFGPNGKGYINGHSL